MGIKVSVRSDRVSPGGVTQQGGGRVARGIGQHLCVDAVTVAQIWLEVAGDWSDGGKGCLRILHGEFLGWSNHVYTVTSFFSLKEASHTHLSYQLTQEFLSEERYVGVASYQAFIDWIIVDLCTMLNEWFSWMSAFLPLRVWYISWCLFFAATTDFVCVYRPLKKENCFDHCRIS